MFLPNKTQRLLVCFGKAVNTFLTQLWKAQFIAESNPPSLPELPPCSLTALPRSKPYTPSHLFPLQFARQHLAAGENKNQCVFPPPHSSASCFTQHRAIRCQDEFSSSWPPPNKPRAIGLLYYRAASAGAAIICLSVLWAGAQEPSLGSV